MPDPPGLDRALDDCVLAADRVAAPEGTPKGRGKGRKGEEGPRQAGPPRGPWASGSMAPDGRGGRITAEEMQTHQQRSATPKAVLNSWSCAVLGGARRSDDVSYMTERSNAPRRPWVTTVHLSGRHWDEQDRREVTGSPRASKLAAEQNAAQKAVQRMNLRPPPPV